MKLSYVLIFYIVLVGKLLYVITFFNLIWTSFAKKINQITELNN